MAVFSAIASGKQHREMRRQRSLKREAKPTVASMSLS